MTSGKGEGYLVIALDIASDIKQFWVDIGKKNKRRNRKKQGKE